MSCREFENWVRTQDVRSDKEEDYPADIESHMVQCESCARLFAVDQALEHQIQSALKQEPLPDGLIDQVNITIDHDTRQKQAHSTFNKTNLVAGIAVIACLVTAYLFFQPFQYKNLNQLENYAVASHLNGNTAMTFTAQNIGDALPLLSKELQFKVTPPDLTHQGYLLLGGRLCILGKCKIAYLFYEYQDKICSVFILGNEHLDFEMAEGSRFTNTIKGVDTHIWKENNQVYAMVF